MGKIRRGVQEVAGRGEKKAADRRDGKIANGQRRPKFTPGGSNGISIRRESKVGSFDQLLVTTRGQTEDGLPQLGKTQCGRRSSQQTSRGWMLAIALHRARESSASSASFASCIPLTSNYVPYAIGAGAGHAVGDRSYHALLYGGCFWSYEGFIYPLSTCISTFPGENTISWCSTPMHTLVTQQRTWPHRFNT